MRRSSPTSLKLVHHGVLHALAEIWSNFLLRAGFTHSSGRSHPHRRHNMPTGAHNRHIFPAMPRDYIRRRRMTRRISNLIVIPLLSIVAAYVITRQPSSGFLAPQAVHPAPQASSAGTPANDSALPAVASAAGSKPAPTDALAAGGYKLGDGPHPVIEVSDLALHDTRRNKDLHVRVFYPQDAGPFPVIVFSHGAGGSQACCDSLTRHWATYGYVTLQPTHDDSVSQRRSSGESEVHFLSGVRDALKNPAFWQSRPEDISFLLDSLSALQNRIPELAGKLDEQHIGVGGHSMGAFTADAIAGARVDLPQHPGTSFADSRVRAALLLSPQGPGEFGLNDHSWDLISIPFMSMTGSLDQAANREGPEWKKIPFDRCEPGDKYHLFIEGANHMSFISGRTLLPGRAAQGEMILGYTNSASLAFWDAYLKADPAAKTYLRSDALPKYSGNAVKLYRR